MILPRRSLRVRPRVLFLSAVVFASVVWSLVATSRRGARPMDDEQLRQRFPLAWKHVHTSKGAGGGKSLGSPSHDCRCIYKNIYIIHLPAYMHIEANEVSSMVHSARVDWRWSQPAGKHHRGSPTGIKRYPVTPSEAHPLLQHSPFRSPDMEDCAPRPRERESPPLRGEVAYILRLTTLRR